MPPTTRVGNVKVNGTVEISETFIVDGEAVTADDIRRWRALEERVTELERHISKPV